MIVLMVAMLLAALLAQAGDCGPEAAALAGEARALGDRFDLEAAVARLRGAAALGCTEADVAAAYLTGLQAAREAYRFGGDADSLAPVRRMEEALMRHESAGSAPAGIARVVLMAAAAAAQSERDDLQVMLDHALQLERVQLAAGAPGAPVVSAHEAAGDLWLQVHRFEAARDAYRRAAGATGEGPRVLLGIARAARRLGDTAESCASYGRLAARFDDSRPAPPELAEAREYLSSLCGSRRDGAAGR
jgi:hypothetical protein